MAVGNIIVLTLLVSISSAIPSENWNRTFGGKGEDWGSSVQQTSDGSYIVAGRFSNQTRYNLNILLIKTDADGIEQWNKTFGGTLDHWANSVHQTGNGGFILAGVALSEGPGGGYNSAVIIKTDADGIQEWYRTFGSSKTDPDITVDHSATSVQQISDGGYVVAGRSLFTRESASRAGGDTEYISSWLIGIDAKGSNNWTITIPDIEANSIQQTSDGGFIVGGKIISQPLNNLRGAALIKTDTSGNQQWIKKFGDSDTVINSVQQTSDGGYIVTGDTTSNSAGGFDAWLIKTDANGNEQWKKTFGGTRGERANSIRQTYDRGYVLAGWTESYGAGKRDAWLIKIDAKGTQQWSKTFGGVNDDAAFSVIQNSEGDYILAGMTKSYGNGNGDAWLIKVSGDLLSGQTAPSTIPGPSYTVLPITTNALAQTDSPADANSTAQPGVKEVAPKTPGFETLFSIAGILAIAYLIGKTDNSR